MKKKYKKNLEQVMEQAYQEVVTGESRMKLTEPTNAPESGFERGQATGPCLQGEN